MERPTIDPKRTGVKAQKLKYDDAVHWPEDSYQPYGPPGAVVVDQVGHFCTCCPGCGVPGAPNDHAPWTTVSGSWDDVTTLTLTPSILNHCCGWHGYLKNGVFESC